MSPLGMDGLVAGAWVGDVASPAGEGLWGGHGVFLVRLVAGVKRSPEAGRGLCGR